jgi:hypothetical protein
MSEEIDIEQPRDAETGQFLPATGNHGWVQPPIPEGEFYGLDSVEAGQGFRQNQPSAEVGDDDPLADERAALDSLFPVDDGAPVDYGITELSTAPAVMVNRETGEPLDPKYTLKPEEAGDQIASYEAGLNTYVDGMADAELQGLIDQRRAEEAKADPSFLAEAGLDKAQVEANARKEDAPEATPTETP